MTIKVLFCCLGNICRSPMCEAVFKAKVDSLGLSNKFSIDSAGTSGYHKGDSPDPRTIQTCQHYQIPISHKARQIQKNDFFEFDYILCMDQSNYSDLKALQPSNSKAKVELFGTYHPQHKQTIIEDPYYGGNKGFETNYEQAVQCTEGFLKHLNLLH